MRNLFRPSINRNWIIRYMEKCGYLLQKHRENYMLFYNGESLFYIMFSKNHDNVIILSTEWKVKNEIEREKMLMCVDECNRQIGFKDISASFKNNYIRTRSIWQCHRKKEFRRKFYNHCWLSTKYYYRIKKIYNNFENAMNLRKEELNLIKSFPKKMTIVSHEL